MIRSTRISSFARVAIAPVLALFIMANASGQDAKPKSPTHGTIRIAYQKNIFMTPMFIAMKKGWLKDALAKEGFDLDASVKVSGSGGVISTALATGDLDAGQIGVGPALLAVSKGVPIQIVANTGAYGEGFVVKKDSPYKTIKDLKGKKVSIPSKGSMQDYVLRKALSTNGMTVGDLDIVVVPEADMTQALLTDQVAMVSGAEPSVSAVIQAGGRMLFTGQEVWPNHENDTFVVSTKLISEHPEAVKAIVDTIIRGVKFLQDNPQEAQAITAESTGLSDAVVKAAWPDVGRVPNARPDLASIGDLAKSMQQDGLLKSVDINRAVNMTFTK
jgi:NitT/TauT family transport system substrate-binding protein